MELKLSQSQATCKGLLDYTDFPNYDIIWTDPPWEQSMLKWFSTKLKKDTGQEITQEIGTILNHLAKLADINKPAVIEYSITGSDRVIKIMEYHGHKLNQIVKCYQGGSKAEMVLLTFNNTGIIPDGITGYKVMDYFYQQVPGQVVFDPFAGIGVTAKAAIKYGKTYIGSELNFKRYEKLKLVIQ